MAAALQPTSADVRYRLIWTITTPDGSTTTHRGRATLPLHVALLAAQAMNDEYTGKPGPNRILFDVEEVTE